MCGHLFDLSSNEDWHRQRWWMAHCVLKIYVHLIRHADNDSSFVVFYGKQRTTDLFSRNAKKIPIRFPLMKKGKNCNGICPACCFTCCTDVFLGKRESYRSWRLILEPELGSSSNSLFAALPGKLWAFRRITNCPTRQENYGSWGSLVEAIRDDETWPCRDLYEMLTC